MSDQETFANKLMTLVNDASWHTPKVEILKALDDQQVNVLHWIEAERAKVEAYLAERQP